MQKNDPAEGARLRARHNLELLRACDYLGSGIIIGHFETHLVQVCWLSEMDPARQDCAFEAVGRHSVSVMSVDPTGGGGNPVTLYSPMLEYNGYHIVGDGTHSDTIYTEITREIDGLSAVFRRIDSESRTAPSFACRIAGLSSLNRVLRHELCLHKRPPYLKEYCYENSYFERDSTPPGFGHCITTHQSRVTPGFPLTLFSGEPLLLQLPKTGEGILDLFWNLLKPAQRVGIAVKMVDFTQRDRSEILIKNKCERVTAKK
jgi:hypothetical protein